MRKYTIAQLKKIAKKYDSGLEWSYKHNSSYVAARNYGVFYQVTPKCWVKHYVIPYKWSLGNIMIEAAKYNTVTSWMRASKSSYNAASRMGILRQVSQTNGWRFNTPPLTKSGLYYKLTKYKTYTQFHKKDPHLYYKVMRQGLIPLAKRFFETR